MPENSEVQIGTQTATVAASDQGGELTVTSVIDTPQANQKVTTIRAHADLLESYVASLGSTYTPWMGLGYIRQLPTPTDDLQRDFGTRLYDEDMQRDPQVYSTLSILVTAVLAQGLSLFPPVSSDDPQYKQAAKIVDFCNWNLKNLRHPMASVLYELVDGMLKMGHKAAEMEYDMAENVTPGAGPQIVLSDIVCKDQHALAFIIDGFSHVLGLVYVRPGQALPQFGMFPNILPGSAEVSQVMDVLPDFVLPRAKFVIPTHKPRNNDPRGTSHLKGVYTAWWKKQQLIPQHMAYVARFAQPSIWANISKDAKDIPVKDAAGNITSYKSIVSAVTEALSQIKSGAVASVIDTEIAMLEAKSEGKVLFDSFELEDRQIAKGILMQTLTTEEAQHMARAASTVHQDVFGILIAFLRSIMTWCIQNEILKPLVLYNFGQEEADTLVPIVSLGDTERQDKPAMMNSLAALALAGGVHPSQWPGLWRTLDFPPVNEDEWETDQKILEAKRQSDLEAATAPQPPPPTFPAPGAPPSPESGAGPRPPMPAAGVQGASAGGLRGSPGGGRGSGAAGSSRGS